ncbi:MAG: hypothetical protein ACXWJJ_15070, partial [Ramlibacter sp.]
MDSKAAGSWRGPRSCIGCRLQRDAFRIQPDPEEIAMDSCSQTSPARRHPSPALLLDLFLAVGL